MRWLVLSLCCLPSAAFAAPCAVRTLDPAAAAGNAPQQLDASDGRCALAVRMLGHFNRMARAIGRRPGDNLHFQVRMVGDSNAHYFSAYNTVSINLGMLGRHTESDLILVLAHEMGHAKQHVDGTRGETLQREGHADALAAQILLVAGYPAGSGQRGVEGWQYCGRITAPNQAPAGNHPVAAGRWQNVVTMTAAHLAMREGLSGARAFDGRGRSVPWVPLSAVGSDGVVRPGALVRRTLTVQPTPRLGAVEAQLLARGQPVPRDRRLVAEVPLPFIGGRRVVATRRILNPGQYFGAQDFNRAVAEAASRIDAFAGSGALARSLTTRYCGRPLDYQSLLALIRDAAAASARRIARR